MQGNAMQSNLDTDIEKTLIAPPCENKIPDPNL